MALTTLKTIRQAGGFRLIGVVLAVTLISTPVVLVCLARGDVGLAWRLFLVWWPGLLMFALFPMPIVLLLGVVVAVWRFLARRKSAEG